MGSRLRRKWIRHGNGAATRSRLRFRRVKLAAVTESTAASPPAIGSIARPERSNAPSIPSIPSQVLAPAPSPPLRCIFGERVPIPARGAAEGRGKAFSCL
jgi:hypothetical protein